MAYHDPPHESHDREPPTDGNVDAPDAGSLEQQIRQRDEQHVDDEERGEEAEPPADRRLAREDDRADLVGDRSEGMSWRDDRDAHRRRLERIEIVAKGIVAHVSRQSPG